MAMELFVLSDIQLNSIDAWQAAIDGQGHPIRLNGKRPIDAIDGFLPVLLRGISTGFECCHWPVEVFIRERPNVDLGRKWSYALAFRWGADFNELQSAWMAAAAYAEATGGIVFDDEEQKWHTAAEARDMVQEIERGMPIVESFLRDLMLKS